MSPGRDPNGLRRKGRNAKERLTLVYSWARGVKSKAERGGGRHVRWARRFQNRRMTKGKKEVTMKKRKYAWVEKKEPITSIQKKKRRGGASRNTRRKKYTPRSSSGEKGTTFQGGRTR